MSDQLRVVIVYGHVPELGEGYFIMFDEIPISTIKLHDISLSEELRLKSSSVISSQIAGP